VNHAAATPRRLWLRRRAFVTLLAGVAALAAALPAHATVRAHRPSASAATRLAGVRPSYPAPRHHHPDAVKRSAATVVAHSKRDGGQSELQPPSGSVLAAAGSAARSITSSNLHSGVAWATAPRAPPARQ
jgi:hypothetical protein